MKRNMARPLGVPALIAIATLSVAGCSRTRNPVTGDSDGQAASAENSTPWATNGAQVTRFPDEIPYGPDAIVKRDGTQVRRSPGSGEVLATLPAGTDVVKLSTHNSEDLVCFDDPTDGGPHLVGWVPQSALAERTPPPEPPPTPPLTEGDADVPPSPPSPSPGGHHHRHRPPRQH
jgi:hypothetical protein